MSEIEGEDNKKYKPYENTGIKEGDTIVEINQTQITSTEELIEKVNESKGEKLNVVYKREDKTMECSIIPVRTEKKEYKLGLWVRDSAAGVGTVTFYDPSTKSFGALGHGILDIDTEQLIEISSGEFVTTKIMDIIKGEKGIPGKIQGSIERIDGEQWFLSLEISTTLSLHCCICDAPFECPVRGIVVQQLIHASEEKSGIFDCRDLIRDELLLEGDRFQECEKGGCPEREFVKSFLKKGSS